MICFLLQARSAAETARKEAEETLETLKADFGNLQAEVQKAQDAADQLATVAPSTGPAQQQQQLSKKAKRKAKKNAKGFGKIDAGDESGECWSSWVPFQGSELWGVRPALLAYLPLKPHPLKLCTCSVLEGCGCFLRSF